MTIIRAWHLGGRRFYLGLLLVAGILACLQAIALPDFEGPDELNHGPCVQTLACSSPYFPIVQWTSRKLAKIVGESPPPTVESLHANEDFRYFDNAFYFKESYRGEIVRNSSLVLSRIANILLVMLVFVLAGIFAGLPKVEVFALSLLFPGVNAYLARINPDWFGIVLAWLYFLGDRHRKGSILVNLAFLALAYLAIGDRSSIFFVCTFAASSVLLSLPNRNLFRLGFLGILALPVVFDSFSPQISLIWGQPWRAYGELTFPRVVLAVMTTATAFFSADGAQSIMAWLPFYAFYFLGFVLLAGYIARNGIVMLLNPELARENAAALVVIIYVTIWMCSLVINPSFKIGRFFFYIVPPLVTVALDAFRGIRMRSLGARLLLAFFLLVSLSNVVGLSLQNPVTLGFFRNTADSLGISKRF